MSFDMIANLAVLAVRLCLIRDLSFSEFDEEMWITFVVGHLL